MSNLPPKPPKPDLAEPKPRGPWLAIMLACSLLFLIVVALTFLTVGLFGPVLVIAGIMAGVVLFHYVVWGWWLEKVLRQAQAEEEARQRGE